MYRHIANGAPKAKWRRPINGTRGAACRRVWTPGHLAGLPSAQGAGCVCRSTPPSKNRRWRLDAPRRHRRSRLEADQCYSGSSQRCRSAEMCRPSLTSTETAWTSWCKRFTSSTRPSLAIPASRSIHRRSCPAQRISASGSPTSVRPSPISTAMASFDVYLNSASYARGGYAAVRADGPADVGRISRQRRGIGRLRAQSAGFRS